MEPGSEDWETPDFDWTQPAIDAIVADLKKRWTDAPKSMFWGRERITYFMSISIGLEALFGGNQIAERDWLRMPRREREFAGKSPMEMLQGPLSNVREVHTLLGRERNI